MSARGAALLAGTAQLLVLLFSLRGGVPANEWLTTILPSLSWLAYLSFPRRATAAIALPATFVYVALSFDWIPRIAFLSWVGFLGAVVFAPKHMRAAANIAMLLAVLMGCLQLFAWVSAFDTLAFAYRTRPWGAILDYVIRPGGTVFFWAAYAAFFQASSREPETGSRGILGLS